MKPIENRHVERIVSLLVVLYGVWLLAQNAGVVIGCAHKLLLAIFRKCAKMYFQRVH